MMMLKNVCFVHNTLTHTFTHAYLLLKYNLSILLLLREKKGLCANKTEKKKIREQTWLAGDHHLFNTLRRQVLFIFGYTSCNDNNNTRPVMYIINCLVYFQMF